MAPRWRLAALGLLWLVALIVIPFLGARIIAPQELLADEGIATIFWSLRVPRTLLALLAGGALAMSGLGLQTLFRNPLAEPYTLGIASGAALGAVLVLQFESLGMSVGFPAVALAAFVGSLVVAAVILGLAMSGWIPVGHIFGDYYNPDGFIARGYRKLTAVKSTAAFFPIGLLLGLLPCGPVYTALIGAARAGMESERILDGIMTGAGLMFAFGLGTIPALFLIGRLAGMGWLKSKRRFYQIGSILMILVGVYFIVKALQF